MRGEQHLALGAAVGVTGAILFTDSITQQACLMISCCAGSLFPDIDIPTSTLGHLLFPVSGIINWLFGHRGFIHTPAFLVCIQQADSLAGIDMPVNIAIPFVAGFLLHLIQDSFTDKGIMWFWPLKKRFHIIGISCDNKFLCWVVTISLFLFFCLPVLFFIDRYFPSYLL